MTFTSKNHPHWDIPSETDLKFKIELPSRQKSKIERIDSFRARYKVKKRVCSCSCNRSGVYDTTRSPQCATCGSVDHVIRKEN